MKQSIDTDNQVNNVGSSSAALPSRRERVSQSNAKRTSKTSQQTIVSSASKNRAADVATTANEKATQRIQDLERENRVLRRQIADIIASSVRENQSLMDRIGVLEAEIARLTTTPATTLSRPGQDASRQAVPETTMTMMCSMHSTCHLPCMRCQNDDYVNEDDDLHNILQVMQSSLDHAQLQEQSCRALGVLA